MKAETRSFYAECVRRVIEEIVRELDGALRLEELAKVAMMSPFHFHRVFRGMIGETPLELSRRLRLERAAWQLTGVKSITEIAFDAGYETHEAFTRTFRSRYAMSPSEFRQRHAHAMAGGASCERPPPWQLAALCGVHFSPDGSTSTFEWHPFEPGEAAMKTLHENEKKVEIETFEARRVAAVRHLGPYSQVSAAFRKLGEIAGPAGLFGPGVSMVGLYYDDPETTPAAELRSDAGLVVTKDKQLPDGLIEVELPGGRYAKALHIGPYEALGDVWGWFMGRWLPQSGERMGGGPSYELYRNSPMDTAPAQLETELYLPLRG